MGSLVIRQVEYNGDKYYFKSPKFTKGINVIKGDNGSGKTTLSFFIEYALGGDIKVFKKPKKNTKRNIQQEKYKEITEDTNNFVLLSIELNDKFFLLKRFIDKNDILVQDDNRKIKIYCVNRQHCETKVFSDWLLDELGIKRFELNLGTTSWYFNFNDLFRLLYYDQDTELTKIYKKPSTNNFVSDSIIIRKSIFETLMGTSSDEYFLKINELNNKKVERQEAKVLLDEFNKLHPNLNLSLDVIEAEKEMLLTQIEKLAKSRLEYQKNHTTLDDKFKTIEEKKRKLVELQLEASKITLKKKNMQIEKYKIEALLRQEKDEIESITKTIFTHEKLNLFDFEICPFCASDIEKRDNRCICGAIIKENNYEKFLYDTSEYKEILKHKNKSLETIESALNSYQEEFLEINNKLDEIRENIKRLNKFIKEAIETIEYQGNSQMINEIDDNILKIKNKLFESDKLEEIYRQKENYEKKYNKKDTIYKDILNEFNTLEKEYKKIQRNILKNFKTIYKELMKNSSAKVKTAEIDEDYMPIIDGGVYREKSARVPIRMMYFYTLISMALKYKTIKHPKFLLMDTPEDSGIDKDNIEENIALFDMAIELAKKNNIQDNYQFILTTGLEKCPKKYEKYVKLDFNKKYEGRFILKEKNK